MTSIVSRVLVKRFVREDGVPAPDMIPDDLYMSPDPNMSNAAFEGRDEDDIAFHPSSDLSMSIRIAPSHQFVCFPSSPMSNCGWDGNYSAQVLVLLDGSSKQHNLGTIRFVCFNDSHEWDCVRCERDSFVLSSWAQKRGFLVGEKTGNPQCLWIICPRGGVSSGDEGEEDYVDESIDSIGNMRVDDGDSFPPTYLPIVDFITGFQPAKTCSEYVLTDVAAALRDSVPLLREIVRQSSEITQSKVEMGVHASQSLSPSQLFAIVLYSFDIALIQPQLADRYDNNFYFRCNEALQTRDPLLIRAFSGYLYFLMSGLEALPKEVGVVYRGIKEHSMPIIRQYYQHGRKVHWSGFSSTSTSFRTARAMAGFGGIVLKIRARSGRKLGQASALPREEEVLLLPNFSAIVSSEIYRDPSTGVMVVELVETLNEATHVF